MEVACVRAGQYSGDLVHPVPYCPELHFSEFSSCIADMKNSVGVSRYSNNKNFLKSFRCSLFLRKTSKRIWI